jgi:hypothetical protein
VLSGDDIFSLNKRFYALSQIFKRLFKSPTVKLWKMLLALNLVHYLAIRINEKRGLNPTR